VSRNFWFIVITIMFILMSFSTLRFNVGFEIRFNQVFILVVFVLILLNDLKNKTLNLKILLYMFLAGMLLSLISLNSIYYKTGELKFIIKYLFVFPAVFYVGSRLIDILGPKNLIKAIEIAVFIYCLDAIILYYFPIPSLIHDRGSLTGFQGTFWETVWLAKALMLFFIASISLRFDFKIFPRKKIYLAMFYLFLIINMIITKSKAIWVGLISVIITSLLVYWYFVILSYRRLTSTKFFLFLNIPNTLKRLNFKYIFGLTVLIFVVLFIFNNFVFEKPIVSKEMIMWKLQGERGKAFKVAIQLLEQSNWIGGYGFGFIEKYFSTFYRDTIVGLGKGVNMIFNSFLDIWLSASIVGLVYILSLIALSFSPRYLFTISIPAYLFVVGNISPYIGSEYFWLFLGISYGIKRYSFEGLPKDA